MSFIFKIILHLTISAKEILFKSGNIEGHTLGKAVVEIRAQNIAIVICPKGQQLFVLSQLIPKNSNSRYLFYKNLYRENMYLNNYFANKIFTIPGHRRVETTSYNIL